MTILKSNYKDWYNEKKMIGVYVPRSIDQYLSMICIDRKISKSLLIRELLEGYIQKKKIEGFDEDALIEHIAKILSSDWELMKRSNKGKAFADFKTEVRQILTAKGIDENNIETILNYITE